MSSVAEVSSMPANWFRRGKLGSTSRLFILNTYWRHVFFSVVQHASQLVPPREAGSHLKIVYTKSLLASCSLFCLSACYPTGRCSSCIVTHNYHSRWVLCLGMHSRICLLGCTHAGHVSTGVGATDSVCGCSGKWSPLQPHRHLLLHGDRHPGVESEPIHCVACILLYANLIVTFSFMVTGIQVSNPEPIHCVTCILLYATLWCWALWWHIAQCCTDTNQSYKLNSFPLALQNCHCIGLLMSFCALCWRVAHGCFVTIHQQAK